MDIWCQSLQINSRRSQRSRECQRWNLRTTIWMDRLFRVSCLLISSMLLRVRLIAHPSLMETFSLKVEWIPFIQSIWWAVLSSVWVASSLVPTKRKKRSERWLARMRMRELRWRVPHTGRQYWIGLCRRRDQGCRWGIKKLTQIKMIYRVRLSPDCRMTALSIILKILIAINPILRSLRGGWAKNPPVKRLASHRWDRAR